MLLMLDVFLCFVVSGLWPDVESFLPASCARSTKPWSSFTAHELIFSELYVLLMCLVRFRVVLWYRCVGGGVLQASYYDSFVRTPHDPGQAFSPRAIRTSNILGQGCRGRLVGRTAG